MKLTASQLFAAASDIPTGTGPNQCYYCGGVCGAEFSRKQYVKDSFSDTDLVSRPGSDHVCSGCVAVLQEKADIVLIDGEHRSGQKVRNYSWIVTDKTVPLAATKAHRERICQVLLNPPEPPFVLCVSDSGQKHFLPHISRVCHSRRFVTCNLDGEIIVYEPAKLLLRYSLTMQLVAVLGGPVLRGGGLLTVTQAMAVLDYHQSETLVDDWNKCCGDSLTRLALWVTPSKPECEIAYPRREYRPAAAVVAGGVQATFGWTD